MTIKSKSAMTEEELSKNWHYAVGWNSAIRAAADLASYYSDPQLEEAILKLDRSVKAIDE